MRTAAHGLSIDLPAGWEARIARRGENAPFMHVASFPLRSSDGEFGAAATGRMRADDAFAALAEYPVDRHVTPGVGLFAPPGWNRRLHVSEFAPAQLQARANNRFGPRAANRRA